MAAVRRVLQASPEPLTLSKIRAALPANFRAVSLEALAEVLQRQVAANVLVPYPKYRSPQDRYWDRPMRVGNGTVAAYYSGSPDLAGTINLVRLTADGVIVTRERLIWPD